MRIVVDTNVVISGVFFGEKPREILKSIVGGRFKASATPDIVDEYNEIVEEMIVRKQGSISRNGLAGFIAKLDIIEPITHVEVCRDPDDDKFISCAIDSKAIYIVSGDKDLLSIGDYEGIKIITAGKFCEEYL